MIISPDHCRKGVPKYVIAGYAHMALAQRGLHVEHIDEKKPWGVEIRILPVHTRTFTEKFFSNLDVPRKLCQDPHGPKILLIDEVRRLSWHVHERKNEFLRVLHGNVGVSMSLTDDETPARIHLAEDDEFIHIPPLMRHRLISTSGWAVVAEISDHPSDDADKCRIKDDHGRT